MYSWERFWKQLGEKTSRIAFFGTSGEEDKPSQSYYNQDGRSSGARKEVDAGKDFLHDHFSYVDVVKESSLKEQVKGSLAISWKVTQVKEKWMSRSAIGVLKEFTSLDSFNQRLKAKGLAFSSSFMGVRNIV
ncbi:hypothetical protein LWI28_012066 [Acer negundo]|uniref:Uncharacterized protein n=1 Tax=Acer negundo TaxID=4023 RepID=A0AAD5JF87_ACENE|nr:hypothetical protein LWI28_012066 [Acer negundo]